MDTRKPNARLRPTNYKTYGYDAATAANRRTKTYGYYAANRRTKNYRIHNIRFSNDIITTTVTCCPEEVRKWISDLKNSSGAEQSLIVGLDTEWRPHYLGHTVAVLQLCVDKQCLVYQILWSPDVPEALAKFLADDRNTFVGVNVKEDLDKLKRDFKIGQTAEYEDLRDLAVRVYGEGELRNMGLKRMAAKVLSVEMEKEKKVTMSRWDGWLTEDQVKYACHDAVVSYRIGKVLRSKLQQSALNPEVAVPSDDFDDLPAQFQSLSLIS